MLKGTRFLVVFALALMFAGSVGFGNVALGWTMPTEAQTKAANAKFEQDLETLRLRREAADKLYQRFLDTQDTRTQISEAKKKQQDADLAAATRKHENAVKTIESQIQTVKDNYNLFMYGHK